MTVTIMKKQKNLKTRAGMFKNMGGNIPGGHFLGGNFPGGSFPGWSLIGGSFPGGNFLGGSFPDTTFTFEDIVQKGILKNLQDSQGSTCAGVSF